MAIRLDGYIQQYNNSTLSGPLRTLVPVTPSDSTDLPNGTTRCITCTTEGDAKITSLLGDEITVHLFPGYNPIFAKRIWATGTTASGIMAGY